MTSSTITTSNEEKGIPEKFGRTMRKAGNIFGLDLAGLFDEEGETTEGFEGFAPTFKGRSPTTATYKAPYQPSRTAEFTLGPRSSSSSIGDININLADAVRGTGGGGGGTQAPLPPMMLPKKDLDRTLRSFMGSNAGGGIGAAGIGRAQEYGYSDEKIRALGQKEGVRFGEQAARSLGINTETTSASGGDSTAGALGAAAVQRLRDRGLADEAIRSLAKQQGMKFGAAAAADLGVGQGMIYQGQAAAAPTPAAPAPAAPSYTPAAQAISQVYQKPSYNSGGAAIGAAGLERMAAARGISFAQARSQAQSAGMRIGAAAQAR